MIEFTLIVSNLIPAVCWKEYDKAHVEQSDCWLHLIISGNIEWFKTIFWVNKTIQIQHCAHHDVKVTLEEKLDSWLWKASPIALFIHSQTNFSDAWKSCALDTHHIDEPSSEIISHQASLNHKIWSWVHKEVGIFDLEKSKLLARRVCCFEFEPFLVEIFTGENIHLCEYNANAKIDVQMSWYSDSDKCWKTYHLEGSDHSPKLLHGPSKKESYKEITWHYFSYCISSTFWLIFNLLCCFWIRDLWW